jgi:hypothetical protein
MDTPVDSKNPATGHATTVSEEIANRFSRAGFRFVPIVRRELKLTCEIDVLFLRREDPGNVVDSGGDIDNRIKVLFDALRMPQDPGELAGQSPASGEDPFFVLLEDDSLISAVTVTTDRLLTDAPSQGQMNDVHLVISARPRVIVLNKSGNSLYL